MTHGRILAAATLAVAAGCLADDDVPLSLLEKSVPELVSVCPSGPPPVDILLLVDNSGSMSQEQAELARTFPLVLAELLDPPDRDGDGAPDRPPVTDLRVGVITPDLGTGGYRVSTCANSDVGDDGCLVPPPAGCASPSAAVAPFLRRDETNAERYAPARLADDLGCLATLGTNGCGFEQQLGAVERALLEQTRAGRCNEGFLRPDSVLVVVLLTDEDDATVDPAHGEFFDPDRGDLGHFCIRDFLHPEMLREPEAIAVRLRELRPLRPRDLLLAAIVGVPAGAAACNGTGETAADCLALPEMTPRIDPANPTSLVPVCSTAWGIVRPAARLVRFAGEFGDQALVRSICAPDGTAAMEDLGARIAARLAERAPAPDGPCRLP